MTSHRGMLMSQTLADELGDLCSVLLPGNRQDRP